MMSRLARCVAEPFLSFQDYLADIPHDRAHERSSETSDDCRGKHKHERIFALFLHGSLQLYLKYYIFIFLLRLIIYVP